MKLHALPRQTSFYETFSDLIFCTLVVFIVIIMALVLQVRSQIDVIVSPVRFTGGARQTNFFVTHVPVGGQTHIVWVPSGVDSTFNLIQSENADGPLDLCTAAVSEDGLTVMPLDDFLGMAAGMSPALANGWISVGIETAGHTAVLVDAQQSRDLRGRSAATVRRSYFGDAYYMDRSNPTFTAWYGWASAYDRDSHHSRLREWEVPLRDGAVGEPGEPPRLRFDIDERTVIVGLTRMSPGDFRNVLRSMRIGRGFYIEYIGGDGSTPPPDWFIDEVLAAVGFDGRVVTEEALLALSGE